MSPRRGAIAWGWSLLLLGILGAHVFDYLANGVEPQRQGNANPLMTPFDIYEAADGPVAAIRGCLAFLPDRVDIIGLRVG